MVLKKEAQLQYLLIWHAHTETEQTKKTFLWLATIEMLKRIEPETIICWPNFLEKDFYCLRAV